MTNNLLVKGSLLVLTPVIFEIVFIVILAQQLTHAQSELAREVRSRSIVNESDKLALELNKLIAGTSIRSDISSEQYRGLSEKLEQTLSNLDQLLLDSGRQRETVKLHEHVSSALSAVSRLVESSELSEDAFELKRQFANRTLRELSKSIDNDLEALTRSDRVVESLEPANREQSARSIFSLMIIAIAGSLLLAVTLSWYFANSIVKRLHVVSDNSLRLARGASLRERLGGDDEIAQLDDSFHVMAKNLKQSMQRERALLENAVDVICSIDESGAFSEVNAAALKAWGFDSSELLGKKFISVIVPDDRQKILDQMQSAIDNQSVLSTECAIAHKNGDSSAFLWTGVWSQDERSWFCVVHDVEERTRIERLKREFTAMISHDLRTPLNSLRLVFEMLLSGTYGVLNEAGRPRVEKAEASVSSLINLTTGLVEFEQQNSGRLQLFRRDCFVADILEAAVESVRPIATQSEIQVVTECSDLTANLDRERIAQVLVNLIGNAIKFSPRGGSILVDVRENDKATLRFSVSDGGAGIPDAYREKIFDRFEQVNIDDARLKGGTGLGLAICKMIVAEHGGFIGVLPNHPQGSIFWFEIPR